MTPVHFADVAAAMAANGYRPVPIKPGKKYPGFDEWEKFTYSPGCERNYPDYGAGSILGELVGLDIDVEDPDAAAAIETAAREILGLGDAAEIPRRTGRAPRVLLPLRTSAPFKKVMSAQFRMHSCPNAKPSKVEVLAQGQQFVAYHVHPDTHRAYEWNGGGDLLTTRLDQLPEITEAQAREIIAAAETVLGEWGDSVEEPPRDKGEKTGTDGGRKFHDGGRNDALTREAGRLRHFGYSPTEIAAALRQVNAERCDPPLAVGEVEAIAKSIGRYAAPEPEVERTGWPDPLDLTALARRLPQPAQFIVADWLPTGYATLFSGHGGVGKSAIGMHLAVCIALGLSFFGVPTERRRVLYLSCEDREKLLHWRLARIASYLGVNLADLAGHLDILDLVGHDAILWAQDPRTGYTVTPAFGALEERMETSGAQVLIVDGVSDAFGGNENARPDVKRFVNALLSIVPPDDGALLLLGHVAKPTAANSGTSEGYSGSTQWHNAVRARWYLYPETEKDDDSGRAQRTGKLMLELQKSNLGRTDQSLDFTWDDDQHLFTAAGTFGSFDRKHRDQMEQEGLLRAFAGCEAANPPITVPAATRGERTAFHVLSKRPEFPTSLRASTRRFWGCIEELRQIGKLTQQENRRSHRHTTWNFVLTPSGVASVTSVSKNEN